MTRNEKADLNRLALAFYKAHGFEVDGDFDFSTAKRAREKLMWNLAVIARRHFEERSDR